MRHVKFLSSLSLPLDTSGAVLDWIPRACANSKKKEENKKKKFKVKSLVIEDVFESVLIC